MCMVNTKSSFDQLRSIVIPIVVVIDSSPYRVSASILLYEACLATQYVQYLQAHSLHTHTQLRGGPVFSLGFRSIF